MFLALSDDEQKFIHELFNQYNRLVYTVAFEILKTIDDAQDVVAEVFIKMINNIYTIENIQRDKLSAYCAVTAKNTALNIIKSRKKTIFLDDLTEIADESSSDVQDFIFKKDDEKFLSGILDELPKADVKILKLRFSDGLSHKEIGKILDISEENSRKRLQRIIGKIKEKAAGGGM